jgi:hypothetical protein
MNHRHVKMVQAMPLKNYSVEVTFSGVTSLLNFMEIYQLMQKLLVGDTDVLVGRLKGEGGTRFLFRHTTARVT